MIGPDRCSNSCDAATVKLPDPVFPPLMTGHPVKSPDQPLARACAGAADGTLGAGDLVWARNLDRLQFALVLEPEVPRDRAREMLFVAMVAIGDSLGALAPPEVGVTFGWPRTIYLNGARLGALSLEMAEGENEDGAPDWMVVGVDLPIRPDPKGPEPGLFLHRTTLFDEGCIELDRTQLIESTCRHLLTWIHRWSEEGFKPVHEAWMFRAKGRNETIAIIYEGGEVSGRFLGLDDHGNMLLNTDGGTELLEVARALAPDQDDTDQE